MENVWMALTASYCFQSSLSGDERSLALAVQSMLLTKVNLHHFESNISDLSSGLPIGKSGNVPGGTLLWGLFSPTLALYGLYTDIQQVILAAGSSFHHTLVERWIEIINLWPAVQRRRCTQKKKRPSLCWMLPQSVLRGWISSCSLQGSELQVLSGPAFMPHAVN